MISLRIFCTGLAAWISGASSLKAEPRSWTNASGKTLLAEFAGVSGEQVALVLPDGSRASVALGSLSLPDQEWVRRQQPVEMTRLPDLKRMPDQVKEPLLYTTVRVLREESGDCLYESAHFEFQTTAKLGVALMKDICRAFESTYELVRVMPWGIEPRPEAKRRRFRAELFESRDQYLATGAPTWSAGVYSMKDKVFRIPFQELGISERPGAGGAYYRKGEINNDTITHEITHQMMHEYVPYMPIWLAEGLAEYTSNIPYRGGTFAVVDDLSVFDARPVHSPRRRGLLAMVSGRPQWIGAEKVWSLTRDITTFQPMTHFILPEDGQPTAVQPAPAPPADVRQIGDHYHSAHLLAAFFVRDRLGLPLRRYFEALQQEIPKWPPFWKALDDYSAALEKLRPDYEAYDKAMKEFMKQPGVTLQADGQIAFPTDLSLPKAPPEAPKVPLPPDRTDPQAVCMKHLHLLLDGRTLGQLAEEVERFRVKVGDVSGR